MQHVLRSELHLVPADRNGNLYAIEGVSRCACGCKYWEFDECVSCGAVYTGEAS